jgi:hypothetical protein
MTNSQQNSSTADQPVDQKSSGPPDRQFLSVPPRQRRPALRSKGRAVPPSYFESNDGGDGRDHRGLALLRFLLTVVSLGLLLPLAYLSRIQAWIRRLSTRGSRRPRLVEPSKPRTSP